MFNQADIVWIAIGCAAALLLIYMVGWLTKRLEASQAYNIERRKTLSPIRTASPVDSPTAAAKEKALESIGLRFSIVRHLFTALMVIGLFLAVILPTLDAVPAAVISTIIAAVGVIIGIAARPIMENVVSGVLITFSGTARIGDTVIVDEHYGTIEDITLTHSVIKVWNWRRYLIPNAKLMSSTFQNLTLHEPHLWQHVEFWVSPDANLDTVKEQSIAAARDSEYFVEHEPPRFWVMEMGKDGVRCWIAAWADRPADAWQLSTDIRTSLVQRLHSAGIKLQTMQVAMREGHDPSHEDGD